MSDITINGLEMSAAQLRYLLYRTFWKQTVDANLNTVTGCEQAATVAADLLCALEDDWTLSGEMQRWDAESLARQLGRDGAG